VKHRVFGVAYFFGQEIQIPASPITSGFNNNSKVLIPDLEIGVVFEALKAYETKTNRNVISLFTLNTPQSACA
jgi:hypothetical protein